MDDKYIITGDELEEFLLCVIHCGLSEGEALQYKGEFLDELPKLEQEVSK